MADIPVGTYPYHKRHAIMDAVQAGLLPHTRLDGDEGHQGCVTVIVKVVPPEMDGLPTRSTPDKGTVQVCPTCQGDGTFVALDGNCPAKWAHRFL